jgi:hypothetical protein
MSDLIDKVEVMGLTNFFQHRCDWNETVICQFYVTLEINMDEETLVWMTGKRRYHATFAEFATVNQLNYNFLKHKHSINMINEEPLDENDYPTFYEPTPLGIPHIVGGTQGLMHHLVVVNKIARVTFMPKIGNKGRVRGLYWNLISHVMNDNKVDIIAIIMDQLADLRVNLQMNLYIAPYIMLFIKAKTRFIGICEAKHQPFRPFKNDIAFLQMPLTTFPDIVVDEDDNENEGNVGNEAQNVDQQAMPPPPPMQP